MTRKILLLPLLLAGCQVASPPEQERPAFFDLEAYFKKEGEAKGTDLSVAKTITLNGEAFTKELVSWDAPAELDGFGELNINRPAWRDQYHVDSFLDVEGRLEELHYAALDSALRIRRVDVFWEKDQVEEVRVEKYIKNQIVFFHQKLAYRPEEGYKMWRAQKVPLTKRSELEVEVKFQR